ncbi:glyceraldehyde 3-phosphate dehydrogenase [Pelomyxa schiedti]|nr:glyceraldehyde 3-phosphate dehydrogenase [Pelomyxa schiedti]
MASTTTSTPTTEYERARALRQEQINALPIGDLSAVPEVHRLGPAITQREYLIDGRLDTWPGAMQEIVSPVIVGGKPVVIGSVPMMDSATSLLALDAAARAWGNGMGVWPAMPISGRIACMQKCVSLMKAQRDRVVNLLMWEIGKNLGDSQREFDRTIEYIIDTIDALKDLDRVSSRFSISQGIIGQIRRSPLGVVLCMAPFNYPFNELFTTLIPALIMGNTVICKPAKFGILIHQPLLNAYRESFPPGVLNFVYGDGPVVVGPLMTSGRVDVLAFIGSSKVANILKKQHPRPHHLRSVLGLEAKNPGIILPDADLANAVKECALGAWSFNGQRCTAIKIIFVHESIAETFVSMLTAAVESLKPGLPWSAGAQLTPLPEPGKPKWMADYVNDAVANGARVANPSGGVGNETFFFPAILYPASLKMKICHEEQFGPVTPVCTFSDIAEPLKFIADSKYGQQVSVFGKDTDKLSTLIDGLVTQTCRVNINCQCQRGPDTFPFTGRKDSAEGTLSVSDALRVLSIRTLVATKATPQNEGIVTEIIHSRKSKFLNTDFIF